MEIGIEEIAKGIILFSKYDKPFDEVISLDKKELRFLEEFKKSFKNLEYIDIKTLNTHNHHEKLKAVQAVINSFNSISFSSVTEFIDAIFSAFDIISPEFKKILFIISDIDIYKIADKNIFKNVDVTEWDREIKENGLYVDIEKHRAPSENNFPIETLFGILFVFILVLHTFVKGEERGSLKGALSFDSFLEIFECLDMIDIWEKVIKKYTNI